MKKDKYTLYLPIKQIYFDQIVKGTKKEEYREIKDTTYKKYLANEDGCLYFNKKLINEDDGMLGDPCIFNRGLYPYFPIDYQYLHLAVGYNKERDTAIVEVKDISFRVMKSKKGMDVIFDFDENGNAKFKPDGKCAFWEIVYHLGKVIDLHRK